ncbi:hypothetical protein TCAL_16668 [Tigriopus californicus]|uniref:WSC domain-containing protein n=1 Tax=Tigriopus californicus TaxID=6832 RepID=A0A553PL67_TIGCA|nr:hypothetical protein TCAL_16668 [Tigriopus californicus]
MAMKFIFWAVSCCSCIGVLSAMQQGSVIPSNKPTGEPYLGNYIIEDSCQYKICGTEYLDEFGGKQPAMSSCSGECDALSHKLVNSKFKKEFLWSKCSIMCAEKYPVKEYKDPNKVLPQDLYQHESSIGFDGFNPNTRENMTVLDDIWSFTSCEDENRRNFYCSECLGPGDPPDPKSQSSEEETTRRERKQSVKLDFESLEIADTMIIM